MRQRAAFPEDHRPEHYLLGGGGGGGGAAREDPGINRIHSLLAGNAEESEEAGTSGGELDLEGGGARRQKKKGVGKGEGEGEGKEKGEEEKVIVAAIKTSLARQGELMVDGEPGFARSPQQKALACRLKEGIRMGLEVANRPPPSPCDPCATELPCDPSSPCSSDSDSSEYEGECEGECEGKYEGRGLENSSIGLLTHRINSGFINARTGLPIVRAPRVALASPSSSLVRAVQEITQSPVSLQTNVAGEGEGGSTMSLDTTCDSSCDRKTPIGRPPACLERVVAELNAAQPPRPPPALREAVEKIGQGALSSDDLETMLIQAEERVAAMRNKLTLDPSCGHTHLRLEIAMGLVHQFKCQLAEKLRDEEERKQVQDTFRVKKMEQDVKDLLEGKVTGSVEEPVSSQLTPNPQPAASSQPAPSPQPTASLQAESQSGNTANASQPATGVEGVEGVPVSRAPDLDGLPEEPDYLTDALEEEKAIDDEVERLIQEQKDIENAAAERAKEAMRETLLAYKRQIDAFAFEIEAVQLRYERVNTAETRKKTELAKLQEEDARPQAGTASQVQRNEGAEEPEAKEEETKEGEAEEGQPALGGGGGCGEGGRGIEGLAAVTREIAMQQPSLDEYYRMKQRELDEKAIQMQQQRVQLDLAGPNPNLKVAAQTAAKVQTAATVQQPSVSIAPNSGAQVVGEPGDKTTGSNGTARKKAPMKSGMQFQNAIDKAAADTDAIIARSNKEIEKADAALQQALEERKVARRARLEKLKEYINFLQNEKIALRKEDEILHAREADALKQFAIFSERAEQDGVIVTHKFLKRNEDKIRKGRRRVNEMQKTKEVIEADAEFKKLEATSEDLQKQLVTAAQSVSALRVELDTAAGEQATAKQDMTEAVIKFDGAQRAQQAVRKRQEDLKVERAGLANEHAEKKARLEEELAEAAALKKEQDAAAAAAAAAFKKEQDAAAAVAEEEDEDEEAQLAKAKLAQEQKDAVQEAKERQLMAEEERRVKLAALQALETIMKEQQANLDTAQKDLEQSRAEAEARLLAAQKEKEDKEQRAFKIEKRQEEARVKLQAETAASEKLKAEKAEIAASLEAAKNKRREAREKQQKTLQKLYDVVLCVDATNTLHDVVKEHDKETYVTRTGRQLQKIVRSGEYYANERIFGTAFDENSTDDWSLCIESYYSVVNQAPQLGYMGKNHDEGEEDGEGDEEEDEEVEEHQLAILTIGENVTTQDLQENTEIAKIGAIADAKGEVVDVEIHAGDRTFRTVALSKYKASADLIGRARKMTLFKLPDGSSVVLLEQDYNDEQIAENLASRKEAKKRWFASVRSTPDKLQQYKPIEGVKTILGERATSFSIASGNVTLMVRHDRSSVEDIEQDPATMRMTTTTLTAMHNDLSTGRITIVQDGNYPPTIDEVQFNSSNTEKRNTEVKWELNEYNDDEDRVYRVKLDAKFGEGKQRVADGKDNRHIARVETYFSKKNGNTLVDDEMQPWMYVAGLSARWQGAFKEHKLWLPTTPIGVEKTVLCVLSNCSDANSEDRGATHEDACAKSYDKAQHGFMPPEGYEIDFDKTKPHKIVYRPIDGGEGDLKDIDLDQKGVLKIAAVFRGHIVDGLFWKGKLRYLLPEDSDARARMPTMNGWYPQSCLLHKPGIYEVKDTVVTFDDDQEVEVVEEVEGKDEEEEEEGEGGKGEEEGAAAEVVDEGDEEDAALGGGACIGARPLYSGARQKIWINVTKATGCARQALLTCRTDRKAGGQLALQYARLLYDAVVLCKQHKQAAWYEAEMQRLRSLYAAGKPMLGPALHDLLDKAFR